MDKTFFQLQSLSCGRQIVVGTDSVTTHEIYEFCKGSVVPVNQEFTIWQCTGCGHRTV